MDRDMEMRVRMWPGDKENAYLRAQEEVRV